MTEPTTPGDSASPTEDFKDTDEWLTAVTNATNRGLERHAFWLYSLGLQQFCPNGVARTWRLEMEHRLARANLRATQMGIEENKKTYLELVEAVHGPMPSTFVPGDIPLSIVHIAHVHRCFAAVMLYQGQTDAAIEHSLEAAKLFSGAGVEHEEFWAHACCILALACLDKKSEKRQWLNVALRELQSVTNFVQYVGGHKPNGRVLMTYLLLAHVNTQRELPDSAARARQDARRMLYRLKRQADAKPPYYLPPYWQLLIGCFSPDYIVKTFGRRHASCPEF